MAMAVPEPPVNFMFDRNLISHTDTVHAIRFSKNGELMATASEDKSIKLWNGESCELQKTLIGHAYAVNDVDWCTDGFLLASASDDKTIKIWDVHRGRTLIEYTGHTSFVPSCKFNCDGYLVVSGSYDETIRIWDRRTGNCIVSFPGGNGPVTSVFFNKEGTCVVSADFNGNCNIWNIATNRCLKRIVVGDRPVTNLRLLPNETWVLTSILDHALKLYSVYDRQQRVIRGHRNENFHIKPDFLEMKNSVMYIISGSEDKMCYIWHFESQNVVQRLEGHSSVVVCAAGHPKEETIFTSAILCEADNTFPIKVWRNSV